MRDLAFFGRRPDGSFAAEIAAPGVDLNTLGRRLFTTDVGLVQIIYTAEIALNTTVVQNVTNGPFGPVVNYSVEGSGTYVFPAPLNFDPEVNITLFLAQQGAPQHFLQSPAGARTITTLSSPNSVFVRYSEFVANNPTILGFSARVNILSTPQGN